MLQAFISSRLQLLRCKPPGPLSKSMQPEQNDTDEVERKLRKDSTLFLWWSPDFQEVPQLIVRSQDRIRNLWFNGFLFTLVLSDATLQPFYNPTRAETFLILAVSHEWSPHFTFLKQHTVAPQLVPGLGGIAGVMQLIRNDSEAILKSRVFSCGNVLVCFYTDLVTFHYYLATTQRLYPHCLTSHSDSMNDHVTDQVLSWFLN